MSLNDENVHSKPARYWQDTVQSALLSKGGLVMSNLAIMIAMLYYSYTANPADPDDINACGWDSNASMTFCRMAFPGLQNSQNRAVGQSICSIALVATPLFLWLLMSYTKYLGLVIRAYGIQTLCGALSTATGLFFLSCFSRSGMLLLRWSTVQVCFLCTLSSTCISADEQCTDSIWTDGCIYRNARCYCRFSFCPRCQYYLVRKMGVHPKWRCDEGSRALDRRNVRRPSSLLNLSRLAVRSTNPAADIRHSFTHSLMSQQAPLTVTFADQDDV